MEPSPSEATSLWPLLLGLLALAIAAVFVARALHQRSRRKASPAPPAPPVGRELDRATQLRTILPEEQAAPPEPTPVPESESSPAPEPPAVPPVTDARAAVIVQEELARPAPAEQTPNEAAAAHIAEEAAAHTAEEDAAALVTLPVEALPAFGDNVVVARGAGPQQLLATARDILAVQAEEADAPDFPDPLVRALDGGGACMSMPGGAGAEAALFVLDALAQPEHGEPVYAEAWVTIRQDDVFLAVSEPEAAVELDRAVESAAAHFPDESDARFGQHVTAAASVALEARGLPFGARLYAFSPAPGTPGAPGQVALTDDAGGGYVAQWERLDEPRLLPVEQVFRAWRDIDGDVRETLGL